MRIDQIEPGAYMLDGSHLLCVDALRTAPRDGGRRVRLAIMEDAVTGDLEPRTYRELVLMRLVRTA